MSEYAYKLRRRTKYYRRCHAGRSLKSLPHAMNPDDVRALLSIIRNIRDKALVLLLLRTGMRIGELLNTKVSDVNVKERKILIFESAKNRIGRVVYVGDDARNALKAWLKKRDPAKDYLFHGQRGNPLTYSTIRVMFVKYLEDAGLSDRKYTLHCLRHTYASELLSAGMPLECLQQLMGHSNIEVTRRYARLTNKALESEYFKAMSIIERGEIDGYYRLNF